MGFVLISGQHIRNDMRFFKPAGVDYKRIQLVDTTLFEQIGYKYKKLKPLLVGYEKNDGWVWVDALKIRFSSQSIRIPPA